MTLDAALLEILACPICRGGLAVMGEQEGLCCSACAKVYPIDDEIPVMLAEEAVPLADWNKGRRRAGTSGPAVTK